MTAKKPCGTFAAYQRHKRNGQTPCNACYAAHAAYNRAARKRAQRRINRDLQQIIHILATELGVGRTA